MKSRNGTIVTGCDGKYSHNVEPGKEYPISSNLFLQCDCILVSIKNAKVCYKRNSGLYPRELVIR